MPVKPNFNPDDLYFVTTNAVKHAHLFKHDVIECILVDSIHHLRLTGQLKLFVFVIMLNHIHLIAKFSEKYPLSDEMRDFKKFTARQVYAQYLAENDTKTNAFLREEGKLVQQEYKVWEDGYDARDIFSTKFLQQKMNYIHQNPCQPQRKLVEKPEDYLWSTAGFYIADKPCGISIDDVREFLVLVPSGLRPDGSDVGNDKISP